MNRLNSCAVVSTVILILFVVAVVYTFATGIQVVHP